MASIKTGTMELQQCVKVGEIKLKAVIFLAHLSVFFFSFFLQLHEPVKTSARSGIGCTPKSFGAWDESSWAKIQKYGA